MSTFKIYFYGSKKFDIGYKHGQEISEDRLFEVAKDIYDKGLNVFIKHCLDPFCFKVCKENNGAWLFVDDGKFGAR